MMFDYKVERIDLDGRQILIAHPRKMQPPVYKRLRHYALSSADIKEGRCIPRIEFFFTFDNRHIPERFHDEAIAGIVHKDLERGKNRIFISLENMAGSGITDESILREKLNHEVFHLYHYYLNAYSGCLHSYERLEKVLVRLKVKEDLRKTRLFLHEFFTGLHMEGMAAFFEDYSMKRIVFNRDEHKRKYLVARRDAHALSSFTQALLIASMIDRRKIADDLDKISEYRYHIGSYMAYCIVFKGRYMMEDLARMNYLSFIRMYDKSEEYQPVVTIDSSKGIVDYNTFLKLLKKS